MIHHLQRILLMSILSSILTACAGERPNSLGVKDGRLSECPRSPNCVSSQAEDGGHRIAPLVFSDDAQLAFARLKKTLARRKDSTLIEESPDYLRVELRTVFFVDDGEFLLDEKQHVIHIRSASRLGYSDLGKNRGRIEEIRREFTQAETKP